MSGVEGSLHKNGVPPEASPSAAICQPRPPAGAAAPQALLYLPAALVVCPSGRRPPVRRLCASAAGPEQGGPRPLARLSRLRTQSAAREAIAAALVALTTPLAGRCWLAIGAAALFTWAARDASEHDGHHVGCPTPGFLPTTPAPWLGAGRGRSLPCRWVCAAAGKGGRGRATGPLIARLVLRDLARTSPIPTNRPSLAQPDSRSS